MRITLICPEKHPRLLYVCEVLLGVLMDAEWEIISPEAYVSGRKHVLSYGCSFPGVPEIPSSGYLFTSEFPSEAPPILKHKQYQGLFPSDSGLALPFDLLSTSFWILTDAWDLQGLLPKDLHGRVLDLQHPVYLNGWFTYPLLHTYRDLLLRLMGVEESTLPSKKNIPALSITLDIDEPWKHRHKPLWVSGGGILKSLMKGSGAELKERYSALIQKEDPFFIFPLLDNKVSLNLFFLIDRHDSRDGRHTWKNSAYKKLIQDCRDAGHTLGIHPSYTSSITKDRIAFEKKKLEEITGHKILHSRQHFLRYKNPETFAELEASGIQHEYSVCPIHYSGYSRGIALPFPWYNILKEKTSRLWLHPMMIMDRALQKYQGLQADQAWDVIQQEIQTTKKAGGTFGILWHNTTLSETGEWTGWRKVWDALMKEAGSQT